MKKLLLKMVILAGIILVICLGFSFILVQKWDYTEDNAASQIMRGFYEEQENSLDVIYLGVSSMRNGISPLVIWNEYGYTGYSRASSVQPTMVSYYLLQESLETQSPKVVFLEAGAMVDSFGSSINDYEGNEGKIHEVLDNMKFSLVKWNMASELAKNSSLSLSELLLPVYRYHDRWQNLTEQDFTDSFEEKYYAYKGNYPSLKRNTGYVDINYMDSNADLVETPCDETIYYTKKISQLCKDNDIALVLVAMPTMSSSYSKHDIIQEFADEEGLDFIDFNLPEIQSEIGLDLTKDYIDSGSHVNIVGSRKISNYIGSYLQKNYELIDKRNDSAYDQWHSDYTLYTYEIDAYNVAVCGNFYTFLERLQDPRYLIIISSKYDASKYFTSDVYSAMQALGLQTDLSAFPYQSYAAIIDGQNIMYEKVSEDAISDTYETEDYKVEFFSDCSRTNTGISSILIDEEEYSKNTSGLNFVVYDKELKRVIASTCFNTGKTGKIYEKE